MNNPFYRQSLLTLTDFSADEINQLLDLSTLLKQQKKANQTDRCLTGKHIGLIFEKDSTRTRVAFEVACSELGAASTYLGPTGSQIGHKESIKDTARVLGRMFDAIQYRGFEQDIVQSLADYAGVPVYNGLTNQFHPTQGLADLLTMREHCDKPLTDITYCFVGDCRSNMGNTLLLCGALMGMDVRLLCPDDLRPGQSVIDTANELATQSGARITVTDNADKALFNCDFVHTDVWVSMGENESEWAHRIELLRDYQVNAQLMKKTGKATTKFMHCLPAFHDTQTTIGKKIAEKYRLDGIEVSDEVFESEQAIVFDQAENRLHTIKAVLVATLVEDYARVLNTEQ